MGTAVLGPRPRCHPLKMRFCGRLAKGHPEAADPLANEVLFIHSFVQMKTWYIPPCVYSDTDTGDAEIKRTWVQVPGGNVAQCLNLGALEPGCCVTLAM